ncbi:hypothetical protein M9H77_21986 [Catharanthus roseus]|uniref:Uncharacterized protein n=1 Tax=Catharanthus roseus TaxID=4058 RepID=A0ACC0AT85_CATRO|nr:hypothetical protein M9H77_21986 [Catharanthus roseus]
MYNKSYTKYNGDAYQDEWPQVYEDQFFDIVFDLALEDEFQPYYIQEWVFDKLVPMDSILWHFLSFILLANPFTLRYGKEWEKHFNKNETHLEVPSLGRAFEERWETRFEKKGSPYGLVLTFIMDALGIDHNEKEVDEPATHFGKKNLSGIK